MHHLRWIALLLVAGPAWAQAPAAADRDYVGAFERLLLQRLQKNRDQRDRVISELGDKAGVMARQARVRAQFALGLGGLPKRKTPLHAKVTGTIKRDGYVIEKVVFESQPGLRVTANLYLPEIGKRPWPAILGTAGHSDDGKAAGTYQQVWITLARRGVAVFAYDPPGQGERSEYVDPVTGKSLISAGVPQHLMTGLQCLLTGQSIARYFVWDGIRAIDYLNTRKEIDPRRIVVAGNSGGGTQAAYLGIADQRLAGVVSACYLTDWRHLWSSEGPQDPEQVLPHWLAGGFDFSDLVLGAAPRPYLISSAEQDYFPIDGARQTFRESKSFYEVLEHGDRIEQNTADQQHGWTQPLREGTYAWLARQFGMPGLAGSEEAAKPEPAATLAVTSTGQLQNSLGSRTIRQLNHDRAVALRLQRHRAQQRKPLTRDTIRQALLMPALPDLPQAESTGTFREKDLHGETLDLKVEAGLKIPARIFVPNGAKKAAAIVLAVSDGALLLDRAAKLAREQGRVVLAVSPRGMAEAAPPAHKKGSYRAVYSLAAKTWLLGESLAGMQVSDLMAALQYLRHRPEVLPERVSIYGWGSAGPLALFAAALDGGVESVTTERSIRSFEELTRAEIYENMENLIVPGLLEHLDLPELAALIGYQRIKQIDPLVFTTEAVREPRR